MFLKKKKKELKKIQSGLLLIHFDLGVGHIHSLLNAQKIRSQMATRWEWSKKYHFASSFIMTWQVYLLHKCNHVYPEHILLAIEFYFSLIWTYMKFFFRFKHRPLTWVNITLRVYDIFFSFPFILFWLFFSFYGKFIS